MALRVEAIAEKPPTQLDFVFNRGGRVRLRPPSEIRRSDQKAKERIARDSEQEYRKGINAPSNIVDSRRIIQVTDGQVNFSAVVIQKHPKTRTLEAWQYMGIVPKSILAEPWDMQFMWLCSMAEDPITEYGFGPTIDITRTFAPDITHIEGGKGLIVKHGGIVFNPEELRQGLYRRLNPSTPEIAKLLGIST